MNYTVCHIIIYNFHDIGPRGYSCSYLSRNFNSEVYCNVLNEVLIENADTLYPDGWKLQEDNSSIHRSKFSVAYKEFRGIRSIDWPSNSPDLNPIENLWAVLKHRVQVRAPNTIYEMERYIKMEWETFDPVFLANFTSSMKRRCNLAIDSSGKKINY